MNGPVFNSSQTDESSNVFWILSALTLSGRALHTVGAAMEKARLPMTVRVRGTISLFAPPERSERAGARGMSSEWSRRDGRLDLVGQSSQLVDAVLANGKPVQRFQPWLRAAASSAACDDTCQVILGAYILNTQWQCIQPGCLTSDLMAAVVTDMSSIRTSILCCCSTDSGSIICCTFSTTCKIDLSNPYI